MMSQSSSISSKSSFEDNNELADYLCPICLQTVDGPAFTDPCYHQFCFLCIMQWIEHKPRCPLCNSNVTAIIQQPDDLTDRIIKTPISNQTAKSASTRRTRDFTYGPSQYIRSDLLGIRKRESIYLYNLHRTAQENPSRQSRISDNPQLLKREIETSRCREWINRDLQVILACSDVRIIESLVVALVKEKGSLELLPNDVLVQFLGDKVQLFLDELKGFVNSTLDMHSYDIYSVYDTRRL